MTASVLALRLRDSRSLRVLRYGLQALACGAVLCLPTSPVIRVLGGALLLATCTRAGRRAAPALRFLELDGEGRCTLDRGDTAAEGRLDAGSLAVPGLIVLAIRDGSGKRRQVWLPDDAFTNGDQRRLRVRLRVAA